MKSLRFNLISLLLLVATGATAQAPEGYYTDANGKTGASLKTALFRIIGPHTNIGYDGLWGAYKKTDRRADGKLWDMYSCTTNYEIGGSAQGKNYKQEGDAYNREHSVPQSWFNEASPMKADIFHVYPTDGYVNNRRSNYPFGETTGDKYKSEGGFSKLGQSTRKGYSGIVFEPNDEYKGDFARTYFYMATCYEDRINGWSGEVFGHGSYPGMASWCVDMFLEWAENDPVSQKEIDRNNAAYAVQGNRNPYIDFPGLEQYVWGDKYKTEQFSSTDYKNPYDHKVYPDTIPPTPSDTTDLPDVPDPIVDEREYRLVIRTSDLTEGAPLLIVCGTAGTVMSEQGKDIRAEVDLKAENGIIITETGAHNKPYAVTLGTSGTHFTLYDSVGKGYLALTGSANKLYTIEQADQDALWDISFDGEGNADIRSVSRSNYSIQYNAGAPRFACYKTEQTPVQIYQGKKPVPESVSTLPLGDSDRHSLRDLTGRPVHDLQSARGIYLQAGRKILVR